MGSLPRTTKSSLSAGTPDSLSDNESATFRTPRKPSSYRSTLTPGGSRSNSRPASRTGSRPGSKPPSRHGSNLSLDSTGEYWFTMKIPFCYYYLFPWCRWWDSFEDSTKDADFESGTFGRIVVTKDAEWHRRIETKDAYRVGFACQSRRKVRNSFNSD